MLLNLQYIVAYCGVLVNATETSIYCSLLWSFSLCYTLLYIIFYKMKFTFQNKIYVKNTSIADGE